MDVTPAADYFLEFSNDVRCKILLKITNESVSPATLTSELSLPAQEIHRQLSRLLELNLVKKLPSSKYIITSTGKIAISQFDFFIFMNSAKNFFLNHNTGDIPSSLILRLGVLKNSEFIKGIGTVIEKYKEIVNEKTDTLRVTLPQIVVDANENVLKHAKKGMKVHYIYGKNTIIPSENEQIEKKYGLKKLIAQQSVKRRIIDHVSSTVVVTDNHAMIMFPNLSNETDVNYAFVSSDESFKKWCLDFFNSKWDEGVNMDGI